MAMGVMKSSGGVDVEDDEPANPRMACSRVWSISISPPCSLARARMEYHSPVSWSKPRSSSSMVTENGVTGAYPLGAV